MTLFLRLVLLLPVLFCGTLVKKELSKPDLETQQETVTRQLRSEGKLSDEETASEAQVAASGLPTKSGTKVFIYIIATALTGGVFLLKGLLPAFQDGLDTAFVDQSHQSGYVKGKMLASQGNYRAALAELKNYAKQTPNDERGVLEMARIQAEDMGMPDAAVATLKQAAEAPETNPEHAPIYALRIVELMQAAKNPDQVKYWAQYMVDKFPSSPQAGVAANTISAMEEAAWLARQNGGPS
jgi:tetratricopeptide (TPR) repeat protein